MIHNQQRSSTQQLNHELQPITAKTKGGAQLVRSLQARPSGVGMNCMPLPIGGGCQSLPLAVVTVLNPYISPPLDNVLLNRCLLSNEWTVPEVGV